MQKLSDAALLFVRGCVRGMALHKVVATLSRPKSGALRAMVGKCVFLNGVLFLGSMLLYDHVIQPLLHFFVRAPAAASAAERVVGALYSGLWLWPLYVVTFAMSSSLHSRIINEAVRVRHSAASSASASSSATAEQQQQQQQQAVSLAGSLSDMSYKTLLYSVFAAQAMLLGILIPIAGPVLSFAMTSLLYSFVCFDVKWSLQKPWRLTRRIDEFQARWAFFLGFGAPFTLTCTFFPLLANCGIYSLLFPFVRVSFLPFSPHPDCYFSAVRADGIGCKRSRPDQQATSAHLPSGREAH